MHQPRPYGQAGAVTDGDRAALDALVRQLTNLKQLSGLPSFKLVRALPSGATAIAQDMGGVLKVIVQPQREEAAQTEDEDGLATTGIPMMFSGVIDQGVVPRGAGVTLKLSASTINRLARQRITVGAQVTLQRFAVGLPQQCSELKPSGFDDNANLFTQYANLRPTWWSNGMAEVVQIVGGYGRQDFANLPDTPAERAMLVLPQSVIDDITAELGAVRLPGYTGKPPMDGGIRYDYKFGTTHGVGFDSAGKPWLVRVSMAGVYAMPLPLVPATTTAAFRRYVADANDDEMQWALNRFGGLPSGESFPDSTGDFEAWRRAGVIVKVCDVGDFYQHFAYGPTMGWAFNRKGTEGVNTVYGLGPDGGEMPNGDTLNVYPYATSYAYKLRLTLSAAVNGGYVQDSIAPGMYDARVLAAYVAGVSNLIQDGSATSLAIHYKMRCAGPVAIMQRAQYMSGAGDNYYNECVYWDNLEALPIASHSGSVERVASGTVENADWFTVPYPHEHACKRSKFLINPPSTVRDKPPAPVMGYYVGDQLKMVNHYEVPSTTASGNSAPAPVCAFSPGSYQWTTDATTLPQAGYTIDDFEIPAPHTRAPNEFSMNVTGTIFQFGGAGGVDNLKNVCGVILSGATGTCVSVRREENSIFEAVCAPFMDRNAILHIVRRRVNFKTTTTSSFQYAGESGVFWCGRTSATDPPRCNAVNGPNGTWGSTGIGATTNDAVDMAPITGYMDFSSLLQPLRVESVAPIREHIREYEYGYGGLPPDSYAVDRYHDAIKVAAGACQYASTSETLGGAALPRTIQGACSLADNSTAHHFIGVINE